MDKTAYFEQIRHKRRAEILSAARELMLQYGPDAFTMQQLARKLDISTVTLYKYYKNSEDIMRALTLEIMQKPYFMCFEPSSGEYDMEALLHYLRSLYTVIMENRDDMTLLFLFRVHTRNHPDSVKDMDTFFSNEGTLYTTILGMLKKAADENPKRACQTPEMPVRCAHFIHRITLAIIEHIALLGEDDWQMHKKELASEIESQVQIIQLYLTHCF